MGMMLAAAALLLSAAAPLPAAAAGQPFASYWHPSTLLAWNPATDPDAPFRRAAVPLAETFRNPALQANPHARAAEARVAALVAFAPTSNNPSQGSQSFSYYALNYWQYIDVLVFWGGSAGEGLILAPNPTVIDAAHRNGVAVLGNVFFPPTAYGGQIQWVHDFLQRSPRGGFPVADKLIQVAAHYGFDGWFINQETAGGDAALAAEMQAFLVYLQTHSDLRVMWYDAMTESGSISWQNALTGANDAFLQDGATRVADDMFLNFWWSGSGLANSRTRAVNLGRDPYGLYAGIDVEGSGYNASVNWNGLFPEGEPHRTSLGIYRPEWTRNSSSGVPDFYARDNRFWVGPNGDPANTDTPDAWKSIAHYVPAQSPIQKLPFVTSFNTGHGTRYAIDGDVLMTGEWNNLSLQDVLPTWRWRIETTGSRLTPAWDWDSPYHGGNALRISGTLDAGNDLLLYQTQLLVSGDTTLQIVYRTGSVRNPPYMQALLAFEDDPTTLVPLDLGSVAGTDWVTVTRDLAAHAGRTLAMIGLRFEAPSLVRGHAVWVGRLAVLDGPPVPPAPPTGLVAETPQPIDGSAASVRLHWTHSPDPVAVYNLYRRNPDQSRTWLGATPNNAYFVPRLPWAGDEGAAPVELVAMGPDVQASTPAAILVPRPQPGLVGHYPLDGNVQDLGPRAAHGTLHGGASFTAGRIGALALACDGIDAHAQIPNPLTGDFTIAFWVRTTATAGTGSWWAGMGMVDGEVAGATADFGTALVGGRAAFGVGNPDTTITSTSNINDGNWHHVAATRHGPTGAIRLFVDAALHASGTGPTAPRTAPASLRIGSLQTGTGFFDGAIDDVRLYNATRTPDDIWRILWFSAFADTYDAADAADPDGDGIPNALERYFGLNPIHDDRVGRPVPTLENGFLVLHYTRNLDATDVPAQAAWSPDLPGSAWSTAFVTDVLLSTDGRIEHRAARVPIGTANPLFFRIQTPGP
jgi:mannosyl-glycoprotein endo-beta-N-acetylglucosaminidase